MSWMAAQAPEPPSGLVEGYRGADVADSIAAHTPSGTIHALRPAAPFYIVSIDDVTAAKPAVVIARWLIGGDDEQGRWAVPAHLAPALVEALQKAAEGDPTDLLALTARAMNKNTN